MLIPRLTTQERLHNITPIKQGLFVFDTDENAFYYVDQTLCWRVLENHKDNKHQNPVTTGDACDQSSGKVPVGGIVMYSGPTAGNAFQSGIGVNEYEGWVLCDGSQTMVNNVPIPDLRARFIVGLEPGNNSSYSSIGNHSDATTGVISNTINESNLPQHTHLVNPTALNVIVDPHVHPLPSLNHTHTIHGSNGSKGGVLDIGGYKGYNGTYSTLPAAENGIQWETDVTHTQNSEASTGHVTIGPGFILPAGNAPVQLVLENRPPWYTLAFIIRVK